MANSTSNDARRRQPSRRRRPAGVPVMLVVVLLIMALLMGGLAGLFIARKTDRHIIELDAANKRITELENRLTLIGADDDADLGQWLADDANNENALDELSGSG